MLKALELAGFKSFAEKTRFEFPNGITVVVGPNGSGKSNVVDAIKWVLGEQSVKSLRGKEMTDVIFNGSGSRRALNSAEATLTFDNSAGLLPIDTPEVHVTRRVFRSGEGEYLLNRQACRLRDIREMFAGTGVATEAYSVIEQGKVDVLLQASPRDRRLIFEEAAGISRFKAKKIESLRRLERVEQNLLRLADIVEEVGNRLKGVRLQAGKARRYREFADRLQLLRTQVGLVDWQALNEKLATCESELAALRTDIGGASAAAEAAEARVLELESNIVTIDAEIRGSEARIAQNRERVALLESTIDHQRSRSRELEERIARHRRQLASLSVRAGNTEQQQRLATDAAASTEARQRVLSVQLAGSERSLTELTSELDRLRDETQQRRAAHQQQTRVVAELGRKIASLDSQVTSAGAAQKRAAARNTELQAEIERLRIELEQLRSSHEQASATLVIRQADLEAGRVELSELRRRLSTEQSELAQLRERQTGMVERASVLEELEKRQEGLSAGVKQVLAQAQGPTPAGFASIRGVLADLLNVSVENAPLIEVALGERAQHLVVGSSAEILAELGQRPNWLQGRVGFLRLERFESANHKGQLDLQGRLGVLGRADQFVQTTDELQPLMENLLGTTWIVELLEHALALADASGPGMTFVTLAGELLTTDGTLSAGPRHASTGLISRRSELRVLREQIAELEPRIAAGAQQIATSERQVAMQDERVQQLTAAQQQAREATNELRMRTTTAEQREASLQAQSLSAQAEWQAATSEYTALALKLDESRTGLADAERKLADLASRIDDHLGRVEKLERQRVGHDREAMAAKVELAKIEQQIESIRGQLRRHEQDQFERQRAITDSREQLNQCIERARQVEREILTAESEIAQLYLRKEGFSVETTASIDEREALRDGRAAAAAEAHRLRGRIRKLEERVLKKELAAGEVRHECGALADRLREDYSLELAALATTSQPEAIENRAAVEAEISDLRQKIGSIGGVNLDALDEVDELEARFESLSSQFQDLSSAKASLEQIIVKINADSRRLFGETLETVKGHFQTLFRKLFGGGQADIVLDPGVDILESGIEIVARPPGKEPRNISLLSGGEKTLTCVALLLAIFRSRPSPFCVLDEVDAALDEANIQRFIGVLTEFLAWTQFIVITHSKKTMTCANTLYGVTMQESGVSKRVSVRFEDVSETGEILRSQEMPAEGEAA